MASKELTMAELFDLYDMMDVLRGHIEDYEDFCAYMEEGGCNFMNEEMWVEFMALLYSCESYLAMLEEVDS